MAKKDAKITFRVLQASPASGHEVTETDKDGNVTGIEFKRFEDVRLGVTNVDAGTDDGAGRLVSGELVLSLPEGTVSTGDVFEATLSAVKEDAGTGVPTTGKEGSTLMQEPDEVERGRTADGSLGGKSGSSGSSSKSGKSKAAAKK